MIADQLALQMENDAAVDRTDVMNTLKATLDAYPAAVGTYVGFEPGAYRRQGRLLRRRRPGATRPDASSPTGTS